jgi:arylsulfatase A-like enzyme
LDFFAFLSAALMQQGVPMHALHAVPALLLALFVSAPSLARAQTVPRPPNIVFILADDLGIGDVGCYNAASKIKTPNLDRLAGQGMRFTDAHSPSAVCTPTRYGILTGRYAWRTRLQSGVLFGLSAPLIARDRPTVATLLKAKGYHTACFGKWHLGLGWAGKTTDDPLLKGGEVDYSKPLSDSPLSHGFDTFFGISGSLDMSPYTFIENDRVTALPAEITGEGGRQGPTAPGFKAPDVLPAITRKAVDYIAARAPDAKAGHPFFLYLPLNAPHTPIVPSSAWKREHPLGHYACFVEQVDDTVGQVLAAIDAQGLAEQTLVIVTSDNGFAPYVGIVSGDDRGSGKGGVKALEAQGHFPSASYRGYKSELWEGGHRVPFLTRWSGTIKPGTTCSGLIGLNDFMATAAELAQSALPDAAAEDSRSFLGLLRGQTEGRKNIILHSLNGRFAVREGQWILLAWPGSGGYSDNRKKGDSQPPLASLPPCQLYDLSSDPSETKNLSDAHPEIVKRLMALLEKQVADGRTTPGAAQTNDVPVQVIKR